MEELAEQLNEFGTWLLDHLVPLSLELALLAGLVVITLRILQIQSSTIRHLFWVLVLIKPIVGFAVSSPISPYSFVFPISDKVVLETDSINSRHPNEVSLSAPTVPADASSLLSSRIQSVGLSLFGLFAVVWLAVALFLVSRLLVGFGALLYLRRSACLQHDGPLHDALVAAFERTDHKRKVRVATSDAVQSPLLTGLMRPLILFPSQLAEKLQQDQLVMVLVHELSHLRRLDNLTLLLQRLMQAALFFHPVVWLCGRMLRREAEQACDDAVIRVTGRSTEYADSLARVAEMARMPIGRSLPMNAFAATESHLTVRIKRLLSDRLGSISMSSRIAAMVTLCVLGFFCLPTMSTEQSAGSGAELAPMSVEELSAQLDPRLIAVLLEQAKAMGFVDEELARIADLAPEDRTEEETQYLRMRVVQEWLLEGQWLEGDLTPDQVVHGGNSVELVLNRRAESQQSPLLLNTIQLAVRY